MFRYEEGTHLAGLNDLEGRGWRWPGKAGRNSDQRQTERLWVMGKEATTRKIRKIGHTKEMKRPKHLTHSLKDAPFQDERSKTIYNVG